MPAVDYSPILDGIKGESQDATMKPRNAIDAEEWSWGESQSGTMPSGGGGAGKVAMKDFSFLMALNTPSHELMLACAAGRHIKSANLITRKAGNVPQEYYKVKMTDVLVATYTMRRVDRYQTTPLEFDEITLNLARIECESRAQNADGTLDAPLRTGWDVKANKRV
jgi:type VI secretion system secreted protein Hcp